MPNYSIIENNTIINTVVADPEYAATHQLIETPEGAGIGFAFDGEKWVKPNQSTTEELASDVRVQRDFKLSSSDWTQVADAPVDQAAWATYRQALRDIPSQAGFPSEVTWPTEPEV
jgi:hypothetical protein